MAETKLFGSMKNAIVSTVKNVVSAAKDFAASQPARIKNVLAVEKSVLTGKGATVVKSSGNATFDKLVSEAASHPFLSAGVVAAGVNPAGALNVLKSAGSSLTSSFASSKLSTKVAVAATVPIATSALLSSKKLRSAAINLPSTQAELGADIGYFAENPSLENLENIFKDNPVASSVAGAAVLGAVGLGAAGLISTISNTQAIKSNTKATKKAIEAFNIQSPLMSSSGTLPAETMLENSEIAQAQPITPSTQVLGTSAGSLSTSRKRRKQHYKQSASQIMRVNIYNQSKHLNTCYAY